jgi:hypothetical protein
MPTAIPTTFRSQERRGYDPADEAAASTALFLLISAALSFLGLFAAARMSRLLDALADVERFHNLTMID